MVESPLAKLGAFVRQNFAGRVGWGGSPYRTSLRIKFPANREKYRENPQIKDEAATRASTIPASARLFGDIPCEI